MEMTCHHCGHNWEYKGNAPYYCTCPHCYYKVKIPDSGKDPWVISDEELGLDEE